MPLNKETKPNQLKITIKAIFLFSKQNLSILKMLLYNGCKFLFCFQTLSTPKMFSIMVINVCAAINLLVLLKCQIKVVNFATLRCVCWYTFDIELMTMATKSPWSNGICKWLNALICGIVNKILASTSCCIFLVNIWFALTNLSETSPI